MGHENKPEGEEVVMEIQPDTAFEHTKEKGVASSESAEHYDQLVAHLEHQLKAKNVELIALKGLQAIGIAGERTVADKEVQIGQIESDIEMARKNADIAREAAEKIPATEVVMPVDYEEEAK
jgi:hypothetical protein